MKGFCHRCGKELNREPYCPDCGAPVEDAAGGGQIFQNPEPVSRRSLNIGVAVISAIAVISILGIVVLPGFMTSFDDEYTATFTAKSISIDLEDHSQYSRPSYPVAIDVRYAVGSEKGDFRLGTWYCAMDGTTKNITDGNIKEFKFHGDPKDVKFSMFMIIIVGNSGDNEIIDYIDIYEETYSDGTPLPKYAGCSGISFTTDGSGTKEYTFSGDSDPKGEISLSITIRK